MQTVSDIGELRACLAGWRQSSEKITLVPTMGNLHAGHLALIEHAKTLGGKVIATIFVNPMQFDRSDDLDAYPRTLKRDSEQLSARGTDLLFAPDAGTIYPLSLDKMTQVNVPVISERLEGASRSGHFCGVATIVCKLFNMIQPDYAVFGEKDYQQLLVIRKMVGDLNMPVCIESVATVREKDGLAMSSRNGYLTANERKIAPNLYKILLQAAESLREKDANIGQVQSNCVEMLRNSGFRPDYYEVCNANTLLPADAGDTSLIILAAAWLGKARLIDNLTLDLKPSI